MLSRAKNWKILRSRNCNLLTLNVNEKANKAESNAKTEHLSRLLVTEVWCVFTQKNDQWRRRYVAQRGGGGAGSASSESATVTIQYDVQSVRLFRGYSTAIRWSPASRPTAAVQPFCEHSEPGHRLVETWRKVQILNEWLAKDVVAVACSSNMNHLSS